MTRSLTRALAALLLPAAALPALAGFEQTTQSISLAYGQKAVTVVFETADGSTVTRAKALCDCTRLKKEGTRLVAEVDTSTFDAPVDKQIEVTTSDGRRTTLTMHFEVPLAVVITPPALIWKRGSAPEAQEFRISIPKGSPVRGLLSADLSGDDFDYRPTTLRKGREYVVSVSPKSTDKRAFNRLVIKMDSSDPRFSQRILYLRVQ